MELYSSCRYLQKAENGIGQQIDAQIQHQRHGADEGKGVGHGGPERLLSPRPRQMENSAPAPMDSPKKIEVRKTMSV